MIADAIDGGGASNTKGIVRKGAAFPLIGRRSREEDGLGNILFWEQAYERTDRT